LKHISNLVGNGHSRLGSFNIERIIEGCAISYGVDYVLWKVIDLSDEQFSKETLNDLLKYVHSQPDVDMETIYQVAFDLVLLSYPIYMRKSFMKAHYSSLTNTIKGTFNYITSSEEKSLDNYSHFLIKENFKYFKQVPVDINRRLLAFLTNCYVYIKCITGEEYIELLSYFILEECTQFEKMRPYRKHPLRKLKVIDLITSPMQAKTVTYLDNRYFECDHIKGSDEYSEFFKRFEEDIPFMPVLKFEECSTSETLQLPTYTIGSNAVSVSVRGDADYNKISDAIRAAPPGSSIVIKPGYYNESLVIDKELKIIGSGNLGQVIIESLDSNCILLKTEYALLQGLKLICRSESEEDYAISILKGTPIIKNCDISSESSCVKISGSETNPSLIRCKIHNGKHSGILVSEKGKGIVEDCDIFENEFAGVMISQEGNPSIKKCNIRNGD
jgi:hypothetical protein